MTHPEELLAEFVDGVLPPGDRAVIDAHLVSCAKCSEEIALARAARPALASLRDEPAPAGIASRAIEAAEADLRTPKKVTSLAARRYRILAVAAAAAVVALIALNLPKLGSNPGGGRTAAADSSQRENGKAGSPAIPLPSASLALEVERTNYDSATASRLAVTPATAPVSGGAGAGPYGAIETASPQEAQAALSCLQTAFPGFTGDPVRLIRASFQGRAAFIGIYIEGPGAGLPANTVSVRVAAVKGCTLLTFTSRQL